MSRTNPWGTRRAPREGSAEWRRVAIEGPLPNREASRDRRGLRYWARDRYSNAKMTRTELLLGKLHRKGKRARRGRAPAWRPGPTEMQ